MILICIAYFSVNTYIACKNWCNTRVGFAIDYLIGAPLVAAQVLWLFVKEYWWKFSNYTGASFYYGFYFTGRYSDLDDWEIKRIKATASSHENAKVRKWANIVIDSYNKNEK